MNAMSNYLSLIFRKMMSSSKIKDLKLLKSIRKRTKITDEKNFNTTLELCLRNQYKKTHKKISKTNYSISDIDMSIDACHTIKSHIDSVNLDKRKTVEYISVRENIDNTNNIISHNFRKSFYSNAGEDFMIIL
jgi:hypothetical protein